jgi:hypothetical protein
MMLGPLVLAAACVVVEGERILFSDLASAVPAFSSVASGESLGLAPAPGARRIVGPAEVGRLAARYGVAWDGGSGICFERASEPPTEAQVLDALAAALRNEPGTWKLVEFSRYAAPRGTLEFFAPPRTDSAAPVQVRGRIRYGDNRSFPVWARVSITRPPRDVERGDPVVVEVASGSALLKLDARAESGGNLGETVVVRNPVSKICFSARVAGKGKVILDANQDSGPRGRGSRGERGRQEAKGGRAGAD